MKRKLPEEDVSPSPSWPPSAKWNGGNDRIDDSVQMASKNQEYEYLDMDLDMEEPSFHFLLLQLRKQCFALDSSVIKFPTRVELEDEEMEELYQNLRKRERREVVLRDYYHTTTEYAALIHEQRLLIIDWIFKESTVRAETKFLGVGLFDRFLIEGFFKTERNLQLPGITCLRLATKIEEAYCERGKKSREEFRLGRNAFKSCEVVAMEWLIIEKLNYSCLLTTVYDFMWFYLNACKADMEVERRAMDLAVLALSKHEMLAHWPSTVAAAVVILASRDSHHLLELDHPVIKVHIGTDWENLQECVECLECYDLIND